MGKSRPGIVAYYWQIMSQHIHCVAKWLFTMANDPFISDNSGSIWSPFGHTHSVIKTITSLFPVTSDADDVKTKIIATQLLTALTASPIILALLDELFLYSGDFFTWLYRLWPYCLTKTSNCSIWLVPICTINEDLILIFTCRSCLNFGCSLSLSLRWQLYIIYLHHVSTNYLNFDLFTNPISSSIT